MNKARARELLRTEDNVKAWLVVPLVLTSIHTAAGQDALGDVARKNREQKASQTRSKVVVNDDENAGTLKKSLFPDIAREGVDNTEQILRAMDEYFSNHKPEEFEAAIREWYDSHDRTLEEAINDRKALLERHINRVNGFGVVNVQDRINDYRQTEMVRDDSRRADDDDRKMYDANGLLTARIQQAFTKVRSHLQMKRLKYEWFKIRFGNGNGSW